MRPWWGFGTPADRILNHGDVLDLAPGIAPQPANHPNIHNFHACSIRGLLDIQRLRSAINALQARHPRMRACFYENPWTSYNYLLESSEQIPLDVRTGSYKTIGADLEYELKVPIDSLKGPFCRIAYIQHPEEGTGLLIFHQNHGVGDGRCAEVILSQLLRLYDGQEVPIFQNVKSLAQLRTISREKLAKWHRIEEQMPRVGPSTILETLVDPQHPAFEVKFDGICIEIVRLDDADVQCLLQACRKHNTTVTAAVGAALVYAIMAELLERKRTTELVIVGMTVNERGRSLSQEFDEECGNFATSMHINCEPKSSFWETAADMSRWCKQVLRDECSFEAAVANPVGEMFTSRERALLQRRANLDQVVTATCGLEHTNMAGFGVLKRFGKYRDFEVLENFACSHWSFVGSKCNICTSGASGRLTACVMVTRNVVPHARELACKLRDHMQTALQGVIADEGSSSFVSVHQWCREIAIAMEGSIAGRRVKLALAPKSVEGSIFQGDTRGNYSTASHLKLFANVLCTLIAGGALSGFPIYVPLMKASGVFNYVCDIGENICEAQDAALQDLYQFGQFGSYAMILFAGYAFDVLGARRAAVLGSLVSCICMCVIGCTICLDARSYPNTQTGVLYICYIVGDVGDVLIGFSLLGWMWHYPACQACIFGLQNAVFMASAMFGIFFVWLRATGIPLYQSFWLIAVTNLLSVAGFHFCTPSKYEYFKEAGKVLNRHSAGMDNAVFIGWLHFKSQLRSLWGVLNLFPLENIFFWLLLPFGVAAHTWWLGGFAEKYEGWFGNGDATILIEFFTCVYSPVGIVLAPAAGLAMDIVGLPPYLVASASVGFILTFTMNAHSILSQKIFIVAISISMGIVQNSQQRWCVVFGPPELFGTMFGALSSWFGLGAIALTARQLSGPLAAAMMGTYACLLLIVAVILRARGIPRHPPKNKYDSPEFLRRKPQ